MYLVAEMLEMRDEDEEAADTKVVAMDIVHTTMIVVITLIRLNKRPSMIPLTLMAMSAGLSLMRVNQVKTQAPATGRPKVGEAALDADLAVACMAVVKSLSDLVECHEINLGKFLCHELV